MLVMCMMGCGSSVVASCYGVLGLVRVRVLLGRVRTTVVILQDQEQTGFGSVSWLLHCPTRLSLLNPDRLGV